MNKRYIKIALALLCVVGYMQNVASASETAVATNSSNAECKEKLSSLPKEVTKEQYLRFKQQVISRSKQQKSSSPKKAKQPKISIAEEAKQAANVMTEALNIAKEHAEHTDDYKLYYADNGAIIHFKPLHHAEIGKLVFTIPNADSYADIVKMLWDQNAEKKLNDSFIKGTTSQIYNENLALIQNIYKDDLSNVYFNALANKVELSENETAILLVSSDMNDHYPANVINGMNYVNPIVKGANSFKPDVNSATEVRIGHAHKMYINLLAVFIKKEADGVKITQLSSIEHGYIPDSPSPRETLRNMTASVMLNTTKIGNIIAN
ncbi:fam-a protein [Plasmodium vinckei brucechwatti]|uniref:Fam-a protein n=1 Tax=Plasmodium vinckei brucechwatti TaxID=119398 RepID=A0A6V7RZ24_PLAVN|nr:fam-a protein [Plasmodium vinckei brucechwatti]